MTLQLKEGQTLANRFTLLHKVQEAPSKEWWLALDAKINERVNLNFLSENLEQPQYDKLKDDIGRSRALIHPNICRVYDLHTSSEGYQFIVSQLVSQYRHDPAAPERSSTTLELLPGKHKYQLELLTGVLGALEYAHSLNLAHGNLNPSNILIDTEGNSYLAGFGLGNLETAQDNISYRSPQVKAGLEAESKDDIYSLGALLYRLFTGSTWNESSDSIQTDFPLPQQMQKLVLSMLSEAPYRRPGSIGEISAIINDYVHLEDNILDSHGQFRKPSGATEIASPDSTAYQPLSIREARLVPTYIVLPVFLFLLISTALVFVYLPESIEPIQLDEVVFDQTPSTPAAETVARAKNAVESSEDATPAPFQLARLAQFKEEANTLAAQLLRQQLYLEDQGVHLWAPDRHKEAQNKAQQGDTFSRAENHADAISSYRAGIEILDQLSVSIEQVKADALQSGQNAITNAAAETAQKAFEIALAIEPTNGAAQEGLGRAQVLDEVLSLVESATSHEDNADLETALLVFKQARALDPRWTAATNGYARVKGKISKRDFNHAMSLGFAALEQEQFNKARDAFKQAQSILPNSSEPADALHQIDLSIRLKQIAGHRGKALALQDKEQWQQAAAEYAAVLQLDPSLLFASQGETFAEQRAQLNGQLNSYISNPVLLNDNDNYESARLLLTQAETIPQPGPRLNQQLAGLANLIKLARMPLQVELRSDKLTDVTVYRVGQFGRLESTQLTLYPGTYRVVGKRRGYQDVQQEFTLVAGQSAPAIFISCTEKI